MNLLKPPLSTDAILVWYHDFMVERLGAVPEGLTAETEFSSLGLDSMDGIVMAGHMEDRFGLKLEPEIFLRCLCLREVLEGFVKDGLLSPPAELA